MIDRKMWICKKCAKNYELVSIIPNVFVTCEPCEECGDFNTAHTDFLTTKNFLKIISK